MEIQLNVVLSDEDIEEMTDEIYESFLDNLFDEIDERLSDLNLDAEVEELPGWNSPELKNKVRQEIVTGTIPRVMEAVKGEILKDLSRTFIDEGVAYVLGDGSERSAREALIMSCADAVLTQEQTDRLNKLRSDQAREEQMEELLELAKQLNVKVILGDENE